MNDLQIFDYGAHTVRTVMIEEIPWWVLIDVCRALGIRNSRDTAKRLDDDEKNTVVLNDGKRGNPRTIVVNESGLYSVILRSDKPEAKAFKRWITHEVLPTIRRTGGYGQPPEISNPTQQIEMLIRAAENTVLSENERRRLLDLALRDLTGAGLSMMVEPKKLPAPPPSSILDLPETRYALKKAPSDRIGRKVIGVCLTCTEVADIFRVSPAEFDDFAERHGFKTERCGKWVRVNTQNGPAREFVYSQSSLNEFGRELKNDAGKVVCDD